ncbi:leucyl aminopeptidase [Cellulomonas fengjieae]|uniref:Probable cytosol aminopeptidase n=1 Tax=Cellulomonas fengjieae TaxID=2819978 RepID=A0ABS3SK14_9CELL|nr:leucyl aminopeptidase [Cellulomonas fengjieae]MBO3086088.1 leucyl aminopeptidase [Cellulomonas fengjieae]QVI65847.1 leucyl aminopeptidase [Cellulomonas fengjieae]
MTFDPIPSRALLEEVSVRVASPGTGAGRALGVAVTATGEVPSGVPLSRDELTEWGFGGKVGETLILPRDGGALVLTGVGDHPSESSLRDAAAAFARAARRDDVLTTDLAFDDGSAQAVVEGILLGRYRYDALKSDPSTVPVREIVLLVDDASAEDARRGADRGLVLARAASLSRDLASTPAGHLTAPDLADIAVWLAGEHGLDIEVFDEAALVEMGCGGLLGVNAGSVVEPRMIVVRYTPATEPRAHLGLVGKGITYDSGGISLKPSNAMHAAMKMDMSGAGAVLAAMTALADLDVPVAVSAYLACTDNMPSGSATKLGDVLTSRSGRTIEVVNTDAEGRLVMADAIALAREDGVDAIVDIATLTGAALAALGMLTAAVIGNDDALLDLVEAAAEKTDEQVWRLPLDRRYRKQLDSDVADIKNLGGEYAGAITAALFLAEWVGDTPWAHLDIAGTMRSESDDAWRTKGATGFGARLLLEIASTFAAAR